VAIRAQREGDTLPIPPLLARLAPEKAWPGQFQKTYSFQPAQLGLKAGDRVTYWAEAEDNREPTANHVETGRRLITVVAGDHAQPREGQEPHRAQRTPDQDRPGAQPSPPQPEPKDGAGTGSQPPETKKNEPSPQKPVGADQDSTGADQKPDQEPNKADSQPAQSDEPKATPDGATDGDTVQKILDQLKNDKGQQQNPQGNQNQQGDQGQPGGQKQAGDQNQPGGQKQAGDQNQPGGQKQAGDQNQPGGQKQAGDQNQPGGQKQAGDQNQPGGQKKAGDQNQPGGQKQAGDQNQPGGQKQAGDQNQPGGQKQAGDQNQPGGQKQAGDQNQPGGQKQAGDQNQPGGQKQAGNQNQPGVQNQPGSASQKQSSQARPNGQPQPGDPGQLASRSPEGAQAKPGDTPAGNKTPGEKSGANEQKPNAHDAKADQQPQDDKQRNGAETEQQHAAGPGKDTGQATGSPPPQGKNDRYSKLSDDAAKGESHKDESPKSPSITDKQSDSKGEEAGDRPGGGEAGGGQHAQKKGVGSDGTHTPSDSGGSQAAQKGAGDTGTSKGEQVKSDHPTGSDVKDAVGVTGQKGHQLGGKGAAEKPEGEPAGNAPPDGSAGQKGDSAGQPDGNSKPGVGVGNPSAGGNPADLLAGATAGGPEKPADDPNLEFARKQTDLALEYLRDQMAKDKSSLLEQLGWSREDAEGFLRRWEQMKRAAGQQGPEGERARKSLNEAIKSLGLRPHGTRLHGANTGPDKIEKLHDAGRNEPPPDWAEAVRNYHRGVATGGR
jgi:hypothetical protein